MLWRLSDPEGGDVQPVHELGPGERVEVVCDLVFDDGWRGTLNHRWFGGR